MKHSIFCEGCAYLFIMPGSSAPQCLATARFLAGPIRSKIDVIGSVSAEKRNANNDCPYRQPVSLRAWEMKRWILWRLSNGEDKLRERRLKDYPVGEEYKRTKKYRKKETYEFEDSEEYGGAEDFEGAQQEANGIEED